jgi:uncharacterized membrane protein YphA (DoxX/SURF4 family)
VIEYVSLVSRFSLASTFVMAGLSKAGDPAGFTTIVRRYEVLPEWVIPIVGRWVPLAELGVGGLLALGAAQVAAASLTIVMLVGFSVAVAWNLIRGRRIDCGCLGVTGRQRISWGTIIRNGVMVVPAVILVARPTTALTLTQHDVSALRTDEAVALLITASTAVAAVLLLSQVRRVKLTLDSGGKHPEP